MSKISYYKGKPYFFYRRVSTMQAIINIKRGFSNKVRYRYVPIYNPKTKSKAYDVYLDRCIRWR